MRKFVVFATWMACAALTIQAQSGKEPKSETLLHWQFAGTKQLAASKDLKTFQAIRALPETAALREAAAHHFAMRAAGRFTQGETNANPEVARLIQPLVTDIFQNESSFHMLTRGAQDADWMLGVKLDAARSEEWNKAILQLAKAAGMQGAAGGDSWTAQRDNYRLSFSRVKGWTVLEGGFGPANAKVAKDFKSDLGKRRGNAVLEMDINTPLLAKIWEAERLAHSPKLSIRSEPRQDGFRTEATLEYPEDLGIKPEKWNVPTGLITEPLIGFTAIQGVKKRLENAEKFKAIGAGETPNQVFFWAQANTPFSIFLAADVKNPKQFIDNAARMLADVKLPMGKLRESTNQPALLWDGLPIYRPKLETAPKPYESFVQASLFPAQSLTNKPAPPELFAQLKKKNLVYYDWEVTGLRMKQYTPIWQLYYLLQGFPTLNTAPSAKWSLAVEERLGNSVTEGILESPRKIKVVRHSTLGFTALELFALLHRFDDADVSKTRIEPGKPQRRAPIPSTP